MNSFNGKLYGSTRRSRTANSSEIYLAILLIGSAVLLIPSVPLRAAIILLWGYVIYHYERYLGLPAPVAPGTMLWMGSVLSYVVGGLGMRMFHPGELDAGMKYLDVALLYLGLGLAAYAFGLRLVGQRLGRIPTVRVYGNDLRFSTPALWFLGAIFIVPVLVRSGITHSGTVDLYNNLIIGALQSIEAVPMIVLAFYLVQPKRHWWNGLVLLAATLAIPWEGIILGYGRIKLPLAIIAVTLTWLALRLLAGERVSRRAKIAIALLPFMLVLFFGVNTAYRERVGYSATLSPEERLLIAQESASMVTDSNNVLVSNIYPLVARLIEVPSLQLLGWAESGQIERVGWTLEDFKQVLLSWVPKTLYPEKGEGYGRDIMEFYGLSPAWNNIPVTILTDAFRRQGLLGVLGLYFMMGVLSTALALSLMPRWGALGLFLTIYFALLHFTIYSSDALEIFKLYIYRFPSSALIAYFLLRITQIWRPVNKSAKDDGS